jgi:hypothetical protein
MKKLIIAAFALTAAASVFAQGTVQFANRIGGGAGVGISLHVWAPSTTAPALSLIGLGSNDNPVGATAFGAASSMVMIGASGAGSTAAKYGYANTFAQLIGANGTSGVLESSLVPLGQTSTFKSGAALGGINLINDTLSGTPAIPKDSAGATFEIVAWDNSTGLYPTWTQAFDAWTKGTIAAGKSAMFITTAIGGDTTPIPNMNNDKGNPGGMTSFNLYFIPEPSTFALAGLGAAAMLIFRRRK